MKKTLFLAFAACGLLGAPLAGQAQSFVGLGYGGNTLSFYSAPGTTPSTFTVTGLGAADQLINVDYFTSSTGQLFGVGTSGTVYTLAPSTATTYAATVNVANAVPGATAADFNPSANRLRVYAGTGNYRVTPGTGVITNDGNLAYASGDPNFGAYPNLTAAAYTNNFAGSTATSLYSIDFSLDALILNTGTPAFSTLTTVATLTLGGVRFDVGAGTTGLDITTVGGVNTAYLSSNNALFTVNLTTGALTSLGAQFGTRIIDVAFTPAVPEPGTYAMLALGGFGLAFLAIRRRSQAAA